MVTRLGDHYPIDAKKAPGDYHLFYVVAHTDCTSYKNVNHSYHKRIDNL